MKSTGGKNMHRLLIDRESLAGIGEQVSWTIAAQLEAAAVKTAIIWCVQDFAYMMRQRLVTKLLLQPWGL